MKRLSRSVFGLMLVAASVLCFNALSMAAEQPLQVGVFEADVTLPLGHPCYPSYEPLETTEFPLLAKGVVIGRGDDRYVICAVDWCEICNSAHTVVRE